MASPKAYVTIQRPLRSFTEYILHSPLQLLDHNYLYCLKSFTAAFTVELSQIHMWLILPQNQLTFTTLPSTAKKLTLRQ